MPSMTKVLTAIQSLRYSEPVINTLAAELSMLGAKRTPASNHSPLPFNRALRLDGVSYKYPDAAEEALRELNLIIHRGTSVGFIGGSGAGKSTLVDVVLGLLTPTEGRVSVDGQDIQGNLRGWQDQIGYVPQSIYLTDDTVRSNVAFGLPRDRIDDDAVWRALRAAQLEEFVRQLPSGLDAFVGERGVRLSGGQRQRIGIARALYHDPAVLVLDEATSALDINTELGVIDAVKALRGDKTILIVAHRISTVEHCETIVRLERGVVAQAGDPQTVLVGMSQADVAPLARRSK
jgi:ABC-type multidrug transport system fused ATPase/permease subunit